LTDSKLVSVIIPAYNEEEDIEKCLGSLTVQTLKSIEIIVIDDGSTDNTQKKTTKFSVKFLQQNHKGPGVARNLGAKRAKGKILVFVDADMTFDKNFIKDLVSPIIKGRTIGTFSKNEMNANKENIWSKFWNINRGWPVDRLIPENYPPTAPVFRAILKSEFNRVGGFETGGEYTDDWSLSKKLGKKADLAKGAVYYHKNPENVSEVWKQARWIGKNKFISGTNIRRFRSIIQYSFPISFIQGIFKTVAKADLDTRFILFKIFYDFAVWVSVLKSFIKEEKYK